MHHRRIRKVRRTFRSTRRCKYRRAVRTHCGPTRTHPADTVHAIGGTAELALRHSIISSSTAGPSYCKWRLRAGRAARVWATPPPIPPESQYLPGTAGRAGAADSAADSAEAAVPSRDYGPDGPEGGLQWSIPRQADDTTTRPSGERAEGQSDVRDSEPAITTSDEARAGYYA
jgi:hypothetical protein